MYFARPGVQNVRFPLHAEGHRNGRRSVRGLDWSTITPAILHAAVDIRSAVVDVEIVNISILTVKTYQLVVAVILMERCGREYSRRLKRLGNFIVAGDLMDIGENHQFRHRPDKFRISVKPIAIECRLRRGFSDQEDRETRPGKFQDFLSSLQSKMSIPVRSRFIAKIERNIDQQCFVGWPIRTQAGIFHLDAVELQVRQTDEVERVTYVLQQAAILVPNVPS